MAQPSKGQPISRLEGVAKVTGSAKYSAEYNVPGLLYGYIINSTIGKGKIVSIYTDAAMAVPGVKKVITHANRPKIAWLDFNYADMDAPPGSPFRPLGDAKIAYNGQPIGLVVAETFEIARYAASLIKVDYLEKDADTNLEKHHREARDPKIGIATLLKPPPPKPKGNFEKAYAQSPVQVSGEFKHAIEHHNPLEMFATTVEYGKDDKLTIYDKTQGVHNCQMYVSNVFGLSFSDVRVISPYVGGAFGSGLRPQYQLFLAVLAALDLKQSVRVSMNRHQMFTFGHRPATLQKIKFGADSNGKLTSLYHKAVAETSRTEDYTEIVVNWSNMMYPAAHTKFEYQLVPLDMASPTDMRAPGGVTGIHAIETAMDEIAHQLNIDPVELRMINYGIRDDADDKPYSSKELEQCYRQAAEKFGWSNRNPEPRSMRKGKTLVGWGMAGGIWDSMQMPARAEASFSGDGKLHVSSAVTDIGTGTYTIMSQIAADEFGLPLEAVEFSYGDSDLPLAPIQGGSFTTATVGTAVQMACRGLRKKLLKKVAAMLNSPFANAALEDVVFEGGKMQLKNDPSSSISIGSIIQANEGKAISSRNGSVPNYLKLKKFARNAHSATFVEVEVDEDFGTIRVTRMVTAVAAGKIINPKTARSQILGSMVWGMSKAIHEESVMDHRFHRFMNDNLGEYHVPVHADVQDLEVIFVEENDEIINDLGVKGLGEIAMVSTPAAVANAIFHATGKRINDFPIRLDALM